MYKIDNPYENFPNISMMLSFLPSSFVPCVQLQELIHSADHVLPHCSKKQVEDLKAKQQAIVTNWKALKSKVEQRRRLLERAYKLYEFQAHVSTLSLCPSLPGGRLPAVGGSQRCTSKLEKAASALCVINQGFSAIIYLEQF